MKKPNPFAKAGKTPAAKEVKGKKPGKFDPAARFGAKKK